MGTHTSGRDHDSYLVWALFLAALPGSWSQFLCEKHNETNTVPNQTPKTWQKLRFTNPPVYVLVLTALLASASCPGASLTHVHGTSINRSALVFAVCSYCNK